MKKVVLGVLLSSLGASLYGAEWEAEFKKLLLSCVVEEKSLDDLKRFREERKEDIGDTDLLKVRIEGYQSVKLFIALLHPDFFKNREVLCKYFSLPEKLFESKKSKEETVVSYIHKALNPHRTINYDYDYSLAKHVFEQCRINVDKEKVGDEFLGKVLDDKIASVPSGLKEEKEFLEKISDLVKGDRTAALLEKVWVATVECLCEGITVERWREVLDQHSEILDFDTKKYFANRLSIENVDVFLRRDDMIREFNPGAEALDSDSEDWKGADDPDKAKKDYTAKIIKRALKTNKPEVIALVTYAIQKRKIDVSLCNYPYDDKHNIAQALIDPTLKVPGRGALKKIADLDPYKGVDDALLAIVRDCLVEKKKLDALDDFLRHLERKKVNTAKSWDEIVKYDGEVFKQRGLILITLDRKHTTKGLSESPKIGAVEYIRDFLTNPDDCPESRWKAECATYAYVGSVDSGSLINLDKEPLLDDNTGTRTLGQELDSSIRNKLRSGCSIEQLKENPTYKFFELVRPNRWATPTNDPKGEWFKPTIYKFLCERDEDTEEQLLYFVNCSKDDGNNNFQLTTHGKFASELLKMVSPNLFPSRQSVEDLIMPDGYEAKNLTWDQNADRKSIEDLAVLCLDVQELTPLFESGYEVYKDKYKTGIAFAGLKYKNGTFGDHVTKQEGHALSGLVPASEPGVSSTQSSDPSKSNQKVLNSSKGSETETSTPVWQSALVLGIVAAVIYGVHLYNSKTDKKADLRTV